MNNHIIRVTFIEESNLLKRQPRAIESLFMNTTKERKVSTTLLPLMEQKKVRSMSRDLRKTSMLKFREKKPRTHSEPLRLMK